MESWLAAPISPNGYHGRAVPLNMGGSIKELRDMHELPHLRDLGSLGSLGNPLGRLCIISSVDFHGLPNVIGAMRIIHNTLPTLNKLINGLGDLGTRASTVHILFTCTYHLASSKIHNEKGTERRLAEIHGIDSLGDLF
jgi:hypothetical protein